MRHMFEVIASKVTVTWWMSTDRQNIRTMKEISVAESNGDVRILTESSQIEVLRMSYKFGQ